MVVKLLAACALAQTPQSQSAPTPQSQVAVPVVVQAQAVQPQAVLVLPQRQKTRTFLELPRLNLPRLVRVTEAPAAPAPQLLYTVPSQAPAPLMAPAPPSKVVPFSPPSKQSAGAGDDLVLEQLQVLNRNIADLRDRVSDLELRNSRPEPVPNPEPAMPPLKPLERPEPAEQRSTAHPAQD